MAFSSFFEINRILSFIWKTFQDPFGASQLGEATESLRLEKLAPNNECNSVAFIENSIFQDNS